MASDYIVSHCKGCSGQVFAVVNIGEYLDDEACKAIVKYVSAGHKVEVVSREKFKLCDCPGDTNVVSVGAEH